MWVWHADQMMGWHAPIVPPTSPSSDAYVEVIVLVVLSEVNNQSLSPKAVLNKLT